MTHPDRRIYGAALPAPEARTRGAGFLSRLFRLIAGKPRRRTLNG